MKNLSRALLIIAFLPAGGALVGEECAHHGAAAQPAASRAEGVDSRGDRGMGFDHAKTAHHFRLLSDGGAIEAEAKDAADRESRDAIRRHFADIAVRFSDGDFALPMFIHAEAPAGVPAMKDLRKEIVYAFEPTEAGGRVRIRSANPKALAAIHEFLRYQIRDHRTGDPQTVGN